MPSFGRAHNGPRGLSKCLNSEIGHGYKVRCAIRFDIVGPRISAQAAYAHDHFRRIEELQILAQTTRAHTFSRI